MDGISPVLLQNNSSSPFYGGSCLSDGDKDKLKFLGGCAAIDVFGQNGLDECHNHLALGVNENKVFSSNDPASTCVVLIYAPGSFIHVEGTKFKVSNLHFLDFSWFCYVWRWW